MYIGKSSSIIMNNLTLYNNSGKIVTGGIKISTSNNI